MGSVSSGYAAVRHILGPDRIGIGCDNTFSFRTQFEVVCLSKLKFLFHHFQQQESSIKGEPTAHSFDLILGGENLRVNQQDWGFHLVLTLHRSILIEHFLPAFSSRFVRCHVKFFQLPDNVAGDAIHNETCAHHGVQHRWNKPWYHPSWR